MTDSSRVIKICSGIPTPLKIGYDMSAHNVLEEQLVADHSLIPPAVAGDLVAVDRSPAILEAEVNCVIPTPQSAGLRLTVFSEAGVVLTAAESGNFYTSATANTQATTITVQAHYICDLISVSKGNGFQYKKIS